MRLPAVYRIGMPRNKKNKAVYLDYAATTPVANSVLKAMRPFFTAKFGNPSSIHAFGQEALAAIDSARDIIANFLHAERDEVIFTSSATEANNWALRGTVANSKFKIAGKRARSTELYGQNLKLPHVIVSAIEHKSVLETAFDLKRRGLIKLDLLPVNKRGVVQISKLNELLTPETVLVSVQYINSEIGTVQPVRLIAQIIERFKKETKLSYPLFHCDAVQAPLYFDVRPEKLGVDLLTLSAHKLYGPKGVALLYIKKGTPIKALITGGGQEYNKRSSTENVPTIVGFAKSIKLAWKHRENTYQKTKGLKKALITLLKKQLPRLRINGSIKKASPHILNISIPGIMGDTLVIALDQAGFAVATGSACQSRAAEASYVLKALGLSQQASLEGVRLSLGPSTTHKEIKDFTDTFAEIAIQLKRKAQK